MRLTIARDEMEAELICGLLRDLDAERARAAIEPQN